MRKLVDGAADVARPMGLTQGVHMRTIIAAGVVALILAGGAHAQLPVDIELRGGAAFPTEDAGDTQLKTGVGGGLTVNVRLLTQVAIYGGWDWFRLNPDGADSDFDIENTGYAFGFQFQRALYGDMGGWARAGGIYTHAEIEDADGELVSDSGHELGWEVGGGLHVPITDRIALIPGVRYRTVSLEFDDDATIPMDLSYLTAEIGFQLRLGPRP